MHGVLEGSVRCRAGAVSRLEAGREEAHSKAGSKPPSSHGAVSARTGQGTSGKSLGSSCDEPTLVGEDGSNVVFIVYDEAGGIIITFRRASSASISTKVVTVLNMVKRLYLN